jgi:hypothetical protein
MNFRINFLLFILITLFFNQPAYSKIYNMKCAFASGEYLYVQMKNQRELLQSLTGAKGSYYKSCPDTEFTKTTATCLRANRTDRFKFSGGVNGGSLQMIEHDSELGWDTILCYGHKPK